LRGRLLLLNLMLLAACIGAAWRLKVQHEQHELRRSAFLGATVPAPPAPAVALPTPPPQISAASYFLAAEKLLLSRDRNPTVIVEVAQPKPVPPLPLFFGAMNFGDGPRVVLALPGKPQKTYVAGDKIGDFLLAAIEPSGLVFQWEDRTIRKRFDELRARTDASEQAPQPSATAQNAQPMSEQPVTSVATVSTIQDTKGPGGEAGENLRYCQPGDSTPPGTIMEGYRKVVRRTPFGQQCLWEKVQ